MTLTFFDDELWLHQQIHLLMSLNLFKKSTLYSKIQILTLFRSDSSLCALIRAFTALMSELWFSNTIHLYLLLFLFYHINKSIFICFSCGFLLVATFLFIRLVSLSKYILLSFLHLNFLKKLVNSQECLKVNLLIYQSRLDQMQNLITKPLRYF